MRLFLSARPLIVQRELRVYPTARARVWYLFLVILSAVTLYTRASIAPGVLPLLQRDTGLTLQQFALLGVITTGISVGASLLGSLSDRVGRVNLIVIGGFAGAATALAMAQAGSLISFVVGRCLLALIEGVSLVAMLALIRDFSPQLSRALALGFFSIGPIGGQIAGAIMISRTLGIFGTWQSQFTIVGVIGLAVTLLGFLALRELAPGLRAYVGAQPQASENAPASESPTVLSGWRKVLRPALALGALGQAGVVLVSYTIGAYLPTWLAGSLHFPLSEANGMVGVYGISVISSALVLGRCSDRLRVRKPLVLGGALTIIAALVPLARATPTTAHEGVAATLALLGAAVGAIGVTWLAAYIETAEAIDARLIGTSLALLNAVQRAALVAASLAFAFVVGAGQNWAAWWGILIGGVALAVPTIFVLAGAWLPPRSSR